jgi:hypothetical protein
MILFMKQPDIKLSIVIPTCDGEADTGECFETVRGVRRALHGA